MEDKDLKEIWKSGQQGEDFNYSTQTIERIIQQGPKNIVSKFIKTLVIEKWANVFILSFVAVYLVIKDYFMLAGVFTLINVAFFLYYRVLIKKLDREYIDSNVVQYLNDVCKIMKSFIKHYIIASWVLVVPAYFVAIYFQQDGFHAYNMSMDAFYWVNFGSLSVAMVVVYYVIHLMYGKKAKRLKSMIDSLKSEEN